MTPRRVGVRANRNILTQNFVIRGNLKGRAPAAVADRNGLRICNVADWPPRRVSGVSAAYCVSAEAVFLYPSALPVRLPSH